jgi:hypothetical protein
MATPYESARLILQLYEMRREQTMREARNFWIGFFPETIDEYLGAMSGPNGAYVRMVPSYWEMAASLVLNGAIDAKMFNEANGEHVIVFGKIEPILPAFREKMGSPDAFRSVETVVMAIPGVRERIDGSMQRLRAMVAARSAAKA